jgi:serine phosphatase RsbU (regulator of sigma subunit)
VNAGMPDVYIFKKRQNKVIEFEACGPPLGALGNFHYKVVTDVIEPGDVILLMSDGFTERFNKDDEMFGCAKCKNLFKENATFSTEEIISRFVEAEKAWSEDRERDDDVTFVVIKCKK